MQRLKFTALLSDHRQPQRRQRVRRVKNFGELASTWVKQAAVVFDNTKGFKREKLAPAYYQNINEKIY